MSWEACAQLVEQGDPLRFRTTMAASPHLRPILFPLYAFNVEVSRAPWLTQEPMIAEMRLQWWRDALEEIAQGGPVRRHDVTTPLADILQPQDAKRLDELVAARRWDVYRDPFEDQDHWDAYIDQTAGHLMWTAARLLGEADENAVRALAFSSGTASFLRAAPDLEDLGRIPFVDGSTEGLKALAQKALVRYQSSPRKASPATWPAIGTAPTLRQVIKRPGDVAARRLKPSLTSLRLLKTSLTHRL